MMKIVEGSGSKARRGEGKKSDAKRGEGPFQKIHNEQLLAFDSSHLIHDPGN